MHAEIFHVDLLQFLLRPDLDIYFGNQNTAKTKQPITVITNGYDTHNVKRPEKDAKFTLAHIGSLLSERNPKQLWTSLKELIDENDRLRNEIQRQREDAARAH